MLGYFHLSTLGWRGAGENCWGGRHTLQSHLRCYYTGLIYQILSVPPQTTLLLFVSRSGGSVINCPLGSGSVRNIQILLFYQRFKEISEKKVHYFINFNDKVYYVPKKSCVTVPLTVFLVGLTVLHVGPVSGPERRESDWNAILHTARCVCLLCHAQCHLPAHGNRGMQLSNFCVSMTEEPFSMLHNVFALLCHAQRHLPAHWNRGMQHSNFCVSSTETPFSMLHDVLACFAMPSVTFLPMETEVCSLVTSVSVGLKCHSPCCTMCLLLCHAQCHLPAHGNRGMQISNFCVYST